MDETGVLDRQNIEKVYITDKIKHTRYITKYYQLSMLVDLQTSVQVQQLHKMDNTSNPPQIVYDRYDKVVSIFHHKKHKTYAHEH